MVAAVLHQICMYKVATLKFDTFQDEAHLYMMYISIPSHKLL